MSTDGATVPLLGDGERDGAASQKRRSAREIVQYRVVAMGAAFAVALVLMTVINAVYSYAYSTLDAALFVVIGSYALWSMASLASAAVEARIDVARVADSTVIFALAISSPGVAFVCVAASGGAMAIEATAVLVVVAFYGSVLHAKFAAEEMRLAPAIVTFWLSLVGAFTFTTATAAAPWIGASTVEFYVAYSLTIVGLVFTSVGVFYCGYNVKPCMRRKRRKTTSRSVIPQDQPRVVDVAADDLSQVMYQKSIIDDDPPRIKTIVLCACLVAAFALVTWYGTYSRNVALIVEQGSLAFFYFLYVLWGAFYLGWTTARCCCFDDRITCLDARAERRVFAACRSIGRSFVVTAGFFASPHSAIVYLSASLATIAASAYCTCYTDSVTQLALGITAILAAVMCCVLYGITWRTLAQKRLCAPHEIAASAVSCAVATWPHAIVSVVQLGNVAAAAIVALTWAGVAAVATSVAASPATRSKSQLNYESFWWRRVSGSRRSRALFVLAPAVASAIFATVTIPQFVFACGAYSQSAAAALATVFSVAAILLLAAQVGATCTDIADPNERNRRPLCVCAVWICYSATIAVVLAALVVVTVLTVRRQL